ncbi:hypothetical protein [Streptomyces sp. SID8352]|uniref:hypothetical protein n=1 Tax=Streptomyces sp. SID8352 TaxID=2690338 RepID=UPI00136F3C7C|nr:hypothetical protein [Streptomyces sp. SID8352]MYU21982.1 hypothetical protein [Streptomyces sp. SID8352]
MGREAGLHLRYERPSVAQWLAGTHPRTPVPALVAEALSRRLGRTITTAEAGFTGRRAEGRPPVRPEETLTLLARAGGASHLAYTVTGLADVPRAAGTGCYEGPRRPDGQAAGLSEALVEWSRATTTMFARSGDLLGAGAIRTPLVGHLANVVPSALAAPGKPSLRREMLIVASGMARLSGSVHWDDGLHGTAQAYYRVSARLADESGDRNSLARVLRTLSMQAGHLGHPSAALDLARAALDQGQYGDVALRALLHGQLASAGAAVGDDRAARANMEEARALVSSGHDRNLSPRKVAVVRAQLDCHRATLARYQGDRDRMIQALREAVRRCPCEAARRRVLMLARLAESQAGSGHVERACLTWTRFLEESTMIRSRSVEHAVTELRSLLRPHRERKPVRELLRRVDRSRGPAGRDVSRHRY